MTSQIENRVMRRVHLIAAFRKVREFVPVKLAVLAAVFFYSAHFIHYPNVLANLAGQAPSEKVIALWSAFWATSAFKMCLVVILAFLCISVLSDLLHIARWRHSYRAV